MKFLLLIIAFYSIITDLCVFNMLPNEMPLTAFYGIKTAMNEMAQRGKKATDAAVRAAQQTSTAMQYLQMQQQQLSVRDTARARAFGAAYRHMWHTIFLDLTTLLRSMVDNKSSSSACSCCHLALGTPHLTPFFPFFFSWRFKRKRAMVDDNCLVRDFGDNFPSPCWLS